MVAQIIEIQIGLHLDDCLLYPHEPCKSQDHRQIRFPPRPRAAIFALLRLLDLPHIHDSDCRDIFCVEGFYKES